MTLDKQLEIINKLEKEKIELEKVYDNIRSEKQLVISKEEAINVKMSTNQKELFDAWNIFKELVVKEAIK